MCDTVIIDGEEFDSIGEVADRLGVEMRAIEGFQGEPDEHNCLCIADIPKMAKEAGAKIKKCGPRSKYFPWSSHEITTRT